VAFFKYWGDEMFGKIKPYSPVDQNYIWIAEYYSGGISEFDLETKEGNSFYDIDKSKLQRFGLIGKGKKMWFECYRGPFNINGDVYNLAYRLDKIYMLTGQDMFQRDIITYKKAIADIDLTKRAGSSKSRIVGYYFGYKTEFKIDGIKFNFKPIVCIPVGQPMYIDIHLVANRDLEGELLFIKNDEIIDTIYAPLKKDVAGGIQWRLR
jgi:hypothetical protein